MSNKLISLGIMLSLALPISARDLGTGNGIPAKDLSSYQLLGNSEQDIVNVPGYNYENNYSNHSYGRGTPDTMAYDYAWGAYFYMTPGDVMVTAHQMQADGILKGVNVRVHRWGTGEQLTVSLHKLSYPLGSDGAMYDQGAVNGTGWLAGYDDGSGITLEGTSWNSAAGTCDGGIMIGNATDPLGSTAAVSGPPGTPTMGLLWPDGFTAATMDPTNHPGIDVGGTGSNWITCADFGSEMDVQSGDWIGIVVKYTGTGGDGSDPGIGFEYATAASDPWKSMKFYSTECGGTAGETGWYIRGFAFNYELAVELTGDRGPVFESVSSLPTTLSTDARAVSAVVSDDNPSGDAAGVAAVILSYQLDSLTATLNTVSMSMTDGDATNGTWEGSIPGQAPGSMVYWSLSATDVGALSSGSDMASYYIFAPTAGNDLIFNNQGALYGNILYSSYLYFYWGGDPFDIWDASYGGIVDELTAEYSTIIELAGQGPFYDNDAEILNWWDGDKTYIVAGDEWLGARSGWTNGATLSGSVARDILGIDNEYNDVNYMAAGDQGGVSRLVAGSDGYASSLAGFVADSLFVDYNPGYETGGSNWLDGVDAMAGFTVDMTGYGGVLDSAGNPDMTDTYNVMIHGQQGNGGKSAFLAFDPVALNTVPSYYWVGASYYWNVLAGAVACPTDASPLIQAYEGLAAASSVDDEVVGNPNAFSLKGNYPNPFNPITNIAFNLDVRSDVTVTVYSLLGEEVATVHNGILQSGLQSIKWNGLDSRGTQVASGVYIYRIEAQNRALTGKMMLLK